MRREINPAMCSDRARAARHFKELTKPLEVGKAPFSLDVSMSSTGPARRLASRMNRRFAKRQVIVLASEALQDLPYYDPLEDLIQDVMQCEETGYQPTWLHRLRSSQSRGAFADYGKVITTEKKPLATVAGGFCRGATRRDVAHRMSGMQPISNDRAKTTDCNNRWISWGDYASAYHSQRRSQFRRSII